GSVVIVVNYIRSDWKCSADGQRLGCAVVDKTRVIKVHTGNGRRCDLQFGSQHQFLVVATRYCCGYLLRTCIGSVVIVVNYIRSDWKCSADGQRLGCAVVDKARVAECNSNDGRFGDFQFGSQNQFLVVATRYCCGYLLRTCIGSVVIVVNYTRSDWKCSADGQRLGCAVVDKTRIIKGNTGNGRRCNLQFGSQYQFVVIATRYCCGYLLRTCIGSVV